MPATHTHTHTRYYGGRRCCVESLTATPATAALAVPVVTAICYASNNRIFLIYLCALRFSPLIFVGTFITLRQHTHTNALAQYALQQLINEALCV